MPLPPHTPLVVVRGYAPRGCGFTFCAPRRRLLVVPFTRLLVVYVRFCYGYATRVRRWFTRFPRLVTHATLPLRVTVTVGLLPPFTFLPHIYAFYAYTPRLPRCLYTWLDILHTLPHIPTRLHTAVLLPLPDYRLQFCGLRFYCYLPHGSARGSWLRFTTPLRLLRFYLSAFPTVLVRFAVAARTPRGSRFPHGSTRILQLRFLQFALQVCYHTVAGHPTRGLPAAPAVTVPGSPTSSCCCHICVLRLGCGYARLHFTRTHGSATFCRWIQLPHWLPLQLVTCYRITFTLPFTFTFYHTCGSHVYRTHITHVLYLVGSPQFVLRSHLRLGCVLPLPVIAGSATLQRTFCLLPRSYRFLPARYVPPRSSAHAHAGYRIPRYVLPPLPSYCGWVQFWFLYRTHTYATPGCYTVRLPHTRTRLVRSVAVTTCYLVTLGCVYRCCRSARLLPRHVRYATFCLYLRLFGLRGFTATVTCAVTPRAHTHALPYGLRTCVCYISGWLFCACRSLPRFSHCGYHYCGYTRSTHTVGLLPYACRLHTVYRSTFTVAYAPLRTHVYAVTVTCHTPLPYGWLLVHTHVYRFTTTGLVTAVTRCGSAVTPGLLRFGSHSCSSPFHLCLPVLRWFTVRLTPRTHIPRLPHGYHAVTVRTRLAVALPALGCLLRRTGCVTVIFAFAAVCPVTVWVGLRTRCVCTHGCRYVTHLPGCYITRCWLHCRLRVTTFVVIYRGWFPLPTVTPVTQFGYVIPFSLPVLTFHPATRCYRFPVTRRSGSHILDSHTFTHFAVACPPRSVHTYVYHMPWIRVTYGSATVTATVHIHYLVGFTFICTLPVLPLFTGWFLYCVPGWFATTVAHYRSPFTPHTYAHRSALVTYAGYGYFAVGSSAVVRSTLPVALRLPRFTVIPWIRLPLGYVGYVYAAVPCVRGSHLPHHVRSTGCYTVRGSRLLHWFGWLVVYVPAHACPVAAFTVTHTHAGYVFSTHTTHAVAFLPYGWFGCYGSGYGSRYRYAYWFTLYVYTAVLYTRYTVYRWLLPCVYYVAVAVLRSRVLRFRLLLRLHTLPPGLVYYTLRFTVTVRSFYGSTVWICGCLRAVRYRYGYVWILPLRWLVTFGLHRCHLTTAGLPYGYLYRSTPAARLPQFTRFVRIRFTFGLRLRFTFTVGLCRLRLLPRFPLPPHHHAVARLPSATHLPRVLVCSRTFLHLRSGSAVPCGYLRLRFVCARARTHLTVAVCTFALLRLVAFTVTTHVYVCYVYAHLQLLPSPVIIVLLTLPDHLFFYSFPTVPRFAPLRSRLRTLRLRCLHLYAPAVVPLHVYGWVTVLYVYLHGWFCCCTAVARYGWIAVWLLVYRATVLPLVTYVWFTGYFGYRCVYGYLCTVGSWLLRSRSSGFVAVYLHTRLHSLYTVAYTTTVCHHTRLLRLYGYYAGYAVGSLGYRGYTFTRWLLHRCTVSSLRARTHSCHGYCSARITFCYGSLPGSAVYTVGLPPRFITRILLATTVLLHCSTYTYTAVLLPPTCRSRFGYHAFYWLLVACRLRTRFVRTPVLGSGSHFTTLHHHAVVTVLAVALPVYAVPFTCVGSGSFTFGLRTPHRTTITHGWLRFISRLVTFTVTGYGLDSRLFAVGYVACRLHVTFYVPARYIAVYRSHTVHTQFAGSACVRGYPATRLCTPFWLVRFTVVVPHGSDRFCHRLPHAHAFTMPPQVTGLRLPHRGWVTTHTLWLPWLLPCSWLRILCHTVTWLQFTPRRAAVLRIRLRSSPYTGSLPFYVVVVGCAIALPAGFGCGYVARFTTHLRSVRVGYAVPDAVIRTRYGSRLRSAFFYVRSWLDYTTGWLPFYFTGCYTVHLVDYAGSRLRLRFTLPAFAAVAQVLVLYRRGCYGCHCVAVAHCTFAATATPGCIPLRGCHAPRVLPRFTCYLPFAV